MGSTLVHCPACDEGLLRERADPQRGGEFGAVLEGHLLRRVVGGEAVLRAAPLAGTALPAHRAPVEDHEVPDRDRVHARADLFDDAGGLVAEQERELVVDPALAVGQVGVAHPARLHPHDHLTRARIRDRDRHDLHRRTLRPGNQHHEPAAAWTLPLFGRIAAHRSRCALSVDSIEPRRHTGLIQPTRSAPPDGKPTDKLDVGFKYV